MPTSLTAAAYATAMAMTIAPITITATVGRTAYRTEGAGRCTYAPAASMYGAAGAMWNVSFQGDTQLRHLALTVFRPRSGADQLTLGIGVGDTNHRISTMTGGKRVGAGTATLRPHDKGGTFEVTGRTAEDTPISLTVRCELFEPAVAEGG